MKSQVFDCFVHFTHTAERETGLKLVDLRSDKGGGAYISNRMKDWCRAHGIKPIMGPPHTPQLNGLAERYNCTLLDRLKPSLKYSSLHRRYWSDALSYAVWTTNRSPTRTNHGYKTPIEVYTGTPPSMRHAHVFGAKGVYMIPSANRDKLDNRSQECIFLGVLPHGDGVRVLEMQTKKFVKTQDAVFDRETTPTRDSSNPNLINPGSSNHESPWLFPEVDHHDQKSDSNVDPNEFPDDQPDSEIPVNQHPQRSRAPPNRLGNLRAYSASLHKSPTYKSATMSSDKDLWTAAMKLEIENFIK